MDSIYFKSPTAFVIQNGCMDELHKYLKKMNITKGLLVTDATISKLGFVDEVIEKTKYLE